jgi:hypothetical protein
MSEDKKIDNTQLVQKCLLAYGIAIRGNWRNIDGSCISDDLEKMSTLLDGEVTMTFEELLISFEIRDLGNNIYIWA